MKLWHIVTALVAVFALALGAGLWGTQRKADPPPLPTFPVLDPAAYPMPRSPLTCITAPDPTTSAAPAKDATPMTVNSPLYRAPTSSPHLDTLAILSVGLSLDVFRQGQVWAELQKQDASQPESLHAGSILPMDPDKYPVTADAKDMAYDKRKADALELGLGSFLEAWPVPTVTVVRGWDKDAPNLIESKEDIEVFLPNMVDGLRPDAGLHWHRTASLPNGVLCSDTPEGGLETVFELFERYPSLPAVLVYAVDGFSMAATLSTRDGYKKLLGVGTGPRVPGELTDAMVALVVARPERVDWLRYFAPYTKVNGSPLYPGFSDWERQPRQAFRPAPFIPVPWTRRSFEEWDALPVLAWLHRPVVVPLGHPARHGGRLRNDALTEALAEGWKTATNGIAPPPARLFFDSGKPGQALAELVPALKAAHSPLDLLQSNESYDLTQRLGDTGAASPFVGIALATMASYTNADTSVVMPLRRRDQATLIAITSATPGKKPTAQPFGVNLLPQTASSDKPSARMQERFDMEHRRAEVYVRPVDAEKIAREKRILDDFIAGGDGSDPLAPKS